MWRVTATAAIGWQRGDVATPWRVVAAAGKGHPACAAVGGVRAALRPGPVARSRRRARLRTVGCAPRDLGELPLDHMPPVLAQHQQHSARAEWVGPAANLPMFALRKPRTGPR